MIILSQLSLLFFCCRTAAGPSLGWESTAAFLILPVFLVVSQFASMQLMQPKTADGQEQPGNFVLKLLPLMIGWFSLNVPAALTLYWVTNNIITTATSVIIRNSMKDTVPVTPTSSAATSTAPPQQAIFTPPREKPSGFGAVDVSPDDVKPLTAMDAEIVDDDEEEEDDSSESGAGMGGSSSQKKKGGKRGKKRKKN